ncbi:hypothetical protein [Streptomyces roseifaciens]|uniref:hypothetical protein n=1 Tax=Streptomyces roseifaciens TaxID=1488406 RepID=UPI0011875E15|nr:hypothetical protein [Streptomyces roseifaciens]
MSSRRTSFPGRYIWLPLKVIQSYSRLGERYWERNDEANHFIVDVAIFLALLASPPKGMRRTRQDILDGLTLVSEAKVLIEFIEEGLLRNSRKRGITFREIADAMGMRSRQAAEQRFLRLAGGSSEAERTFMNRRRQNRFGYVVDTQHRLNNHSENLALAFRILRMEQATSDDPRDA